MNSLFCLSIIVSVVNSEPASYISPFNDLEVGDYVMIKGISGGYLKDNNDGSTLISSTTFDETAIWEVTNDTPYLPGIEFKNTRTGNYIKANGTNCFVGSLPIVLNPGIFNSAQDGTCCCVDSADSSNISHSLCSYSCAQFTFYVIRFVW